MNIKINISVLFLICICCAESKVIAQTPHKLTTDFSESSTPKAPDYEAIENWAAHPNKVDKADSVPRKSGLKDLQSEAKTDVFFIHPTTYTYEPTNQFKWNGDINDKELNEKTDNSTILNQASVFNGSCRVFAPRYRQAHYSAFTTEKPENKKQSLDIAYEDVKSAFEFYLKNHNDGRPIVIASHSQGTIHAGRLIKEFIDGKPLQKQFVEAYLIGISTPPDYFETIKVSETAEHTGGFVTWNTFLKDFTPPYYNDGLAKAICVNPLTWNTNDTYAPKALNKGGVGLKFTFVKQLADAQIHDNMLWINKPYVRGRIFLKTKIWHIADINLFWMNIRENVALRIDTFLASNTFENNE
ncbi:MAG: DUF3089 domain-containing protein [Spirosomaceae bacterium]|nr:DUF3089 domain-containing protein [Spirosomataceae bacterium]